MEKFEAEEANERVPNCRITSGLAAIFIAAGAVMDRLAFPNPEQWKLLVFLRMECSATLLLLYALLGGSWGKKHHLMLGHMLEVIVIVSILTMIGITGGKDSPYYAGLCLVMVGAGLLLRWSFWHGLFNVVFACGGFTVLIFLSPDVGTTENANGFIVSTFFLYATGFFTAAGTYFLYDLRKNEFRLREELDGERKRLEESHRQLKDLDKSKTNFFANISHELRTPLTLILGPIEDLSKSKPVQEDARLRSLVASMEDNGLRLLRLVNELLGLIRLDGGGEQLRAKSFAVPELLQSLKLSIEPMAHRKKLTLDIDDTGLKESAFYGDQSKIEKVLINLTMNAVKFTPPGGNISISASQEASGQLTIAVKDTGEGMSEEDQVHVFRRFWQVDESAKRRHQGAGIGLSLVKGLLDLMGGEIAVVSELGKGTTFTITIPESEGLSGIIDVEEVDSSEEDFIEKLNRRAVLKGEFGADDDEDFGQAAFMKDDQDAEAKPIVLVADDEPDIRRLMVSQLSDYQLLVAKDGLEAIELARRYQPDLVLLDWMMPGLDGLEVCQLIRTEPALARIPVIILTARVDEESKLRALDAGVNDFLNKPFVPTELRLRIRNLLSSSEFERDAVQKSEALEVAIDDLKESESMLVQAEKLSSLGQMSAGIIHEINNPLNYAKTNLYSLRTFGKLLPEDDVEDFREILTDVEEGLERVVQIVQDLRSFAVKDKAQYSDTSLAAVVATSARLMGNRLSQVNFQSSVPDHVLIDGNANQLCQVFVNFLQNSLDALAEVERENDEGSIELSCEQKGDWIALHIRDNGCGISPENQQKIFVPFFTSKDVGHGMGLGLSICYRILNQHGVKIELESEIGKGTHFTLNFPVILDDSRFEDELIPLVASNLEKNPL